MIEIGIFLLLIFAFLIWRDSKNIERSIVLFVRRTRVGLTLLDKFAKIPFLQALYTIAIPLCFFGIFFITLLLTINAIYIIRTPTALPGLTPVIPGIRVPGAPIFIPLGYGLLALFLLLIFHEGSHGIAARINKIKVRSAGFVLFFVIPGAFVEPDQKSYEKSRTISKLRMVAAGSFGNFLLAVLSIILMIFLLSPVPPRGLAITEVMNNTPAQEAFQDLTVIKKLNNQTVKSFEDAANILKNIEANETVYFSVIQKNDSGLVAREIAVETITAPNATHAFVGITKRGLLYPKPAMLLPTLLIQPASVIFITQPLYWSLPPESNIWYILSALKWIAFLNFSIGLINLLPIIPLDGGIMIREIVNKFSPRMVKPVSAVLSLFILLLLTANLLPYFA